MAENSKISWTTHTFNPWIGCTKVSPGCAHCYAEALMDTRYGRVKWGAGQPRVRTSAANWKLPLKWNRAASYAEMNHDDESNLGKDLGAYERPRVFCASLADWLDDEVPVEWRADLLHLIYSTPGLDWLLLSKRPQHFFEHVQNILEDGGDALGHFIGYGDEVTEFGTWLQRWRDGTAPQNVWVGTTVEDQERANERIPQLLQIPARVRFLSCEPLVGAVDIRAGVMRPAGMRGYFDWVICGGESGQNARPMHPEWARSLRDQCATAGVPFFFKQWGEYHTVQLETHPVQVTSVVVNGRARTKYYDWSDGNVAIHVGTKFTGRELDGVIHNAFPEVTNAQ